MMRNGFSGYEIVCGDGNENISYQASLLYKVKYLWDYPIG